MVLAGVAGMHVQLCPRNTFESCRHDLWIVAIELRTSSEIERREQ